LLAFDCVVIDAKIVPRAFKANAISDLLSKPYG